MADARQQSYRRWGPALIAGGGAILAAASGLSTNLVTALVPQDWLDQHQGPIWVLTTAFIAATVVLAVFAVRASEPAAERARSDVRRALLTAVRLDRQRFMDQALGVQYDTDPAQVTFADPGPGTVSASGESLLVQWQDVRGRHAGSISEIAAFYRAQVGGRLMILGPPGSGKTVLLSRLVLDLIDQIGQGGSEPAEEFRIPVWLSLTSFDTQGPHREEATVVAERLRKWVTSRLVQDYQLPSRDAADLVDRQQIVPVLDGLDEMDSDPTEESDSAERGRPHARAVLRALSTVRYPVVLACRDVEYRALTETVTLAPAPLLTDARHVSVKPLDAGAVTLYLRQRLGGRSRRLPARWEPVEQALHSRTDLGAPVYPALHKVLTNPWHLFLSVTAYHETTGDPRELLDMGLEEAQSHLLASLIPAVVHGDGHAAAQHWRATNVHRWLTAIAERQNRASGSSTDIRLPDLWQVSGRCSPRWVTALVAAGMPAVIGFFSFVGGGVFFGVFFVLTAAGIGRAAFSENVRLERIDLHALRSRSGMRRMRMTIVGTLMFAAAYGLADTLDTEAVGLALVTGVLLALGLKGRVQTVPSPSILARQCLHYSLSIGMLSALAFGLAAGWAAARTFTLATGIGLGLMFGLAGGLGMGLARANGHGWLRYLLGVRAAARRDLLPHRPAQFLDWCLRVGLMRMSGNNIQFRHRQLQDWLAVPHGLPYDPEPH